MINPRRMWVCLWVLWCSVWCSGAETVGADGARALTAAAQFQVESTVLVSGEGGPRGAAAGYRVRAGLSLRPASPPHLLPVLLRLQLQETRVETLSARARADWQPRASLWDAHPAARAPFYGERGAAGPLRAFLDPADPPDILNYKKALLSLFQFQVTDGEYNETDVSGACHVRYEALSDTVFRKFKRGCEGAEGAAGAAGAVSVKRVTRYSVRGEGDALSELHAEEVVSVGGAGAAGAPRLKARSWHSLALRSTSPAAPSAPDAASALASLPPPLRETALPLELPPAEETETPSSEAAVAEAVRQWGEAALGGEEAGGGGTADAARALLRLLPALRAAPEAALAALLREPEQRPRLPALCRALGLAGTAAAGRAARRFTSSGGADPLEAAAVAYLQGLALAARPHHDAVLGALRLAEEARAPALAGAALLAAAAAAPRALPPRAAPAAPAAPAVVRDHLLRTLPNCKEEQCRAVRLQALANLGAEAGETLLAHAERPGAPGAPAALAALRGLRRAPSLTSAHLERLGRLAANGSVPLEVRAGALDLVVARRAGAASRVVPVQLARLAGALLEESGPDAHELRRVLWGRLDALAHTEPVRALRDVLPRPLATWHARAHGGTSSVLRRDAGWAWRGAGAQLDSVQLAARGLLRRGAVTLLAVDAAGAEDPELEVELWTRGLDSLAGTAPPGGEPETPAGGLALGVGGARLAELALFEGQAELLGHLWAGTGSEPTPVARAARETGGAGGAVALGAGAVLRWAVGGAAALALDAHATASLWQRTARGGLALRAGGAGAARAAVRTAAGELRAAAAAGSEPRLRIDADLDFYDGVALCVRSATAAHVLERSVELRAPGGARWAARWSLPSAGRSLALGRANDAACRRLRAADES